MGDEAAGGCVLAVLGTGLIVAGAFQVLEGLSNFDAQPLGLGAVLVLLGVLCWKAVAEL